MFSRCDVCFASKFPQSVDRWALQQLTFRQIAFLFHFFYFLESKKIRGSTIDINKARCQSADKCLRVAGIVQMVSKSREWFSHPTPEAAFTIETPIMSHLKTAAFNWRATYTDVSVPLFYNTKVFKYIGFVSMCSVSVSHAVVYGAPVHWGHLWRSMSATRLQCLLRTNKNYNRFPRSEKNPSLYLLLFSQSWCYYRQL